MDIQEYILSGVIETYVLGLASISEVQEVETLAAQNAEVRLAITTFEEALEKQAIANAVPPPADLKQRVMVALVKEGMDSAGIITTGQNTTTETRQGAKVVSITEAPKGVKWLRGAIAASVILLLGSAILNFYFYSQYKKYNGQYTELLAKQNVVLAKNDVLQASYNTLRDTSVTQVKMPAANPTRSGSFATVLWDQKSKDVYLMVNNLPKPADDKQYQLWAIVDGKPVDAGMLPLEDETGGLLHMKNITGKVQAFAITLEKKGGSPGPTMEQMYVVGSI